VKETREHGKLVALFITDPRSPAAKARRDETWQELLQGAPETRERLVGAEQDGAPRSYVAGPAYTSWAPGERWLPVGDAALSFDPIAADGLCFALRSAIEAAAHINSELAGKPTSDSYRTAIRRIYDQHLSRRLEHYRAEASAHLPFWQRRLDVRKDASPIRSKALAARRRASSV
jgi:flavin-dependent dehydrogenase